MANPTEIRQSITAQIIEALRGGGLPPWRKGWSCRGNGGLPTSVSTGHRYSGVNVLLLQMASGRHGLRSKFWGTFNQWRALGGKVKRRPDHVPPGEWGCQIIFYKPITKTETDRDTGEEAEVTLPILRSYCVFNVDQVEGAHLDKFRAAEVPAAGGFIDYEPAEKIIRSVGADIRFGGDRAFYRRPTVVGDGDFIQMPPKRQFGELKEFYATAFHELAHWSECRTGWTGSYAEGELRAEIAAAYMLAEIGVPQSDDMTNHHAYLASWLKALQDDPRFIFSCSTAASRVADHLLACGQAAGIIPVEAAMAG